MQQCLNIQKNEDILKRIEELEEELKNVKGTRCEVYARVVGFFRPTMDWNAGKQEEFKERKMYDIRG